MKNPTGKLLSHNIFRLFQAAATTNPETSAFITEAGQAVTYAQLQGRIEATAAGFRKQGVETDDRVLVFVPMSVGLYVTVLALFKIGATAVFVDEWADIKRLRKACRLADCRGFAATGLLRSLAWLIPEIRRIPVWLNPVDSSKPATEPVPTAAVNPADHALITFTTGSTGTPKAADRTHGFLAAQYRGLLPHLLPEPGQRVVTNLPIVALCYLGAGATVVLADFKARRPERFDARNLLERLRRFRVNTLVCSPYFLERLAVEVLERGAPVPSGLKKLLSGGAPVFPALARRAVAAFPDAEIQVAYGSTEAEPVAVLPARVLAASTGTTGLPAGKPDQSIRLAILPIGWDWHEVDPESWAAAQLAAGQIGEIVVSGAHVLTAYFRSPEAFREQKIRVGTAIWHRTGDAGYLSQDGSLILSGRCGQLIPMPDGDWQSIMACEIALAALPGVRLGTVLQVEGKWIAVLESDATKEALELLASVALPVPFDAVVVMRRIPRDSRHFSKIDYGRLRRELGSV